jgi:hypothetical protein
VRKNKENGQKGEKGKEVRERESGIEEGRNERSGRE